MSLLQKVLRGSFLNLMDQGVRVVAMLLVTPVVVSHLGLERYGIWLLVMAAISFLALLDGGVTLSGTRFLARSIGGTGSQEEIIGTLRWLYWRIGLACLVGTLGLALAVPWLVQDQQWQETARWALLALGGSMTVRFFLRIHLVVLKAHLRYDLIVTASLVKVVLQSVLVVVLLVRGHGLVVLALAQILSDLVDQFLVVMFSKRTESSLPAARHSPVLLPEILRYSGIAFLQTMGQHLRSQADPFILSAFVGVSSVPVYNMAMRLVSLFDDMVNAALGGTLLSAFSHVEGRSGMAGLKVQYLFSLRFSVILTLLGGAGLFVLGPAFLVAWLGEGFSESGFLLRLILIPAMFKLMQYPGYGLLYSINQHYQLTKLTFAGGLINAVLSIALTSQIGIQGVALATFIEMSLFYIVILPVIISSTISMPLITYYRELLKPAVKLAIPLVLWGVCIHPYVQPDFLRLALAGSSLIPVVALGSLFLLFSRQERGELYLRLRRAPSAAEPAAPLK